MSKLGCNNWQSTVIAAIAGLPDDLQASVGYRLVSDEQIIVTVACEPIDDDEESLVRDFDVRWWNTRREQLESHAQEEPAEIQFGALHLLKLEQEHPLHRDKVDKPVIAIEPPGDLGVPVQGFIPELDSCGLLKRAIQETILEVLWGGGGVSMVGKDEDGRFCREDGSLILPDQGFDNENTDED